MCGFCPTDISINNETKDEIRVNWDTPVCTDNSGNPPSISANRQSGSWFAVPSSNEITYIVSDGTNENKNCSFRITIKSEYESIRSIVNGDVYDILRWLPVKERQEYHLSKLAFKALCACRWPENLKLDHCQPTRSLRSSSQFKLNTVYAPRTFQYNASRVFYSLPLNIRSCNEFDAFNNVLRSHFYW